MATTTIRATIASTHPVDKYPGWRLTPEALEALAERLRAGDLPMLFDHDVRERITASCRDAHVDRLSDGHAVLVATFEVDEDRWRLVEEKFSSAGVAGGFSFSATTPQLPARSSETTAITLAVDAAAWSDSDREAAWRTLDAVVPTRADRLFQYSGIELATIFLVLGNVALGALGNAAYDAIKFLVGRRSDDTRIEVHRTNSRGESVKAVVTTSDPELAREALEKLLPEQNAPTTSFNTEKRLWMDYLS